MGGDLIRPVLVATLLVALFTFFFVYPGHDPKPNDLPIGVSAGSAGMAPAASEGFEIVEYPDAAAAREAILDREIYGAITEEGVLVASAASPQIVQILTAQAGDAPVTDVVPLDPDDPRGTSINLTVLPLTVTAILGALLIFSLAPAAPSRARLAAIAMFAVFAGLVSMLVAKAAIGVLPGSFVALWAVVSLGVFALATCSSALMRALGPPGIGASFMLFLMLGNPASGAAGAPHLLPDPWSWGGQLLPPGALATGVRNTAYFDGAHLAEWLIVLLVWAAIGTAALLLAKPPEAVPGGEGDRPVANA